MIRIVPTTEQILPNHKQAFCLLFILVIPGTPYLFPADVVAEVESVFCDVDTNIIFHVNPFLANTGSLFTMSHATVRVHIMDTTPDQATIGLRAPGWADLDARTISLSNYYQRHYTPRTNIQGWRLAPPNSKS
jgi:hypothetical protein